MNFVSNQLVDIIEYTAIIYKKNCREQQASEH